MKRLIVLMALSMFIAISAARAQDPGLTKKEIRKERHAEKKSIRALKGKEVSYQSKQRFAENYGNATDVKWERTAYFDQASFVNKDGKPMTAYYDDQSNLVGTTTPASFTDLPAAAQRNIERHFKNYKDATVVFFDDNEFNQTNMIIYGEEFEDEDNYFVELRDDNGKPIVLRVTLEGEVTYFADIK
ncbi:hypothetical protein [Chitinophaga sp. HK235]|uniref:hypothetical protein n=1 Tax=Chitinophaga sp. HK235 TaxID=2952571 RepID=UPI001BA9C942|nr:hypothetical protein [Chitinophaga sp. HK235]